MPEATYEENTPEEQAQIDAELRKSKPKFSDLHRAEEALKKLHQDQIDWLYADNSPLNANPFQAVKERYPDLTDEEIANYCFQFGFKIGVRYAKRKTTRKKARVPIGVILSAVRECGGNRKKAAELINSMEKYHDSIDPITARYISDQLRKHKEPPSFS